jgi:hypothetical protein
VQDALAASSTLEDDLFACIFKGLDPAFHPLISQAADQGIQAPGCSFYPSIDFF